MKSIMIGFVLGLCLAMAACSALEQKAGPTIAKGVAKYCETPLEARQALRDEVNKLAAPNSIRVCCSGDPNSTLCTQP